MRGRSRLLIPLAAAVALLLPLSCGESVPPAMELGWTPNAPAVYRVSVSAQSGFSGPTSDLEGATDLTTALRVTPVSPSEASVEVMYFAASVADSSGEMVALDLGGLAGEEATVRFGTPGVVSSVEGGERLLEAPVPLVPVEYVVRSLFPSLPEGSFREGDTWTAETAPPFPNLGEPPVRMRYVAQDVAGSGESGRIEGYELSVRPRTFDEETPGGGITGRGDLNVEFRGELETRDGYRRTENNSTFESEYVRLEGGGYANGNARLDSEMVVERLSSTEQFGLDP